MTGNAGKSDVQDRLTRFRELLLDISPRLIGASPVRISTEIDQALKLTGELWGFKEVALAVPVSKKDRAGIIGVYRSTKNTDFPAGEVESHIPWIMERVRAGKVILLSSVSDDLPESAVTDRRYLAQEGIRSAMVLPLKTEDSVEGALFIFSLNLQTTWDSEVIRGFSHLADMLVRAVNRREAARPVKDILNFERFLSDISATYINLPRQEIDKVIKNDLGRLAGLLRVDRCVFYEVDENKHFTRARRSFTWWPEEDEQEIRALDAWSARQPGFSANFQYCFDKWMKGEHIRFTSLEELPEEANKLKWIYGKFGVKSSLSLPVSVGGSIVGALVVTTVRAHRRWPDELIPRLRLFGEIVANAMMRKRNEEEIQDALSQIRKLKEQIEADYIYLREEIKHEHNFADIVGKSDALKRILIKVKQVAPTNATVLLLGETGTGKGLIARAVHNESKRRDRPFVQVNCAALSASLIESELFGHEKGSFTGAAARRIGRFESAHGTTLFLDEIGDLPLELQPKLLRVLQDGEFERVGGTTTIRTDVRIIAATNRDLEKEVETGRFRRDLWYRLSTFPILVPPLRERLDDIPFFVPWFVEKYSKWIGKSFSMIPQKAIRALQDYSWPGNIRELENTIERAVIASPNDDLRIEIPTGRGEHLNGEGTLEEIEKRHIVKVLEEVNWVIEGPEGAARRLGLKPSTLRFKAKKLGINRPRRPA